MNFQSALDINNVEYDLTSMEYSDDDTLSQTNANGAAPTHAETSDEPTVDATVERNDSSQPSSELSRELQVFMPADPAALMIVGRMMDYYPLLSYVNSQTFKDDYEKREHAKSLLSLQTGVNYEYRQRVRYVSNYINRLLPATVGKDVGRLVYFLKFTPKPYTKFVQMTQEMKRRIPHFNYKESVSYEHITTDFPGFLSYKFFKFEEDNKEPPKRKRVQFADQESDVKRQRF